MWKLNILPARTIIPIPHHGVIRKVSPSSCPSITQPTSLLQWLVVSQGASPSELKVERTYQGDDCGWGLFATEDIPADGQILSVPLASAITSQVTIHYLLFIVTI